MCGGGGGYLISVPIQDPSITITFITCFYDFEFQLESLVNIMSIFMGV
jgi:hypothetical protein